MKKEAIKCPWCGKPLDLSQADRFCTDICEAKYLADREFWDGPPSTPSGKWVRVNQNARSIGLEHYALIDHSEVLKPADINSNSEHACQELCKTGTRITLSITLDLFDQSKYIPIMIDLRLIRIEHNLWCAIHTGNFKANVSQSDKTIIPQ